MDARESTDRQVGGDDALTIRIGAVALPLAIIVILVSEIFHNEDTRRIDEPASGTGSTLLRTLPPAFVLCEEPPCG